MSLKKLGAAILVAAALSAVLTSSALATATPNEVNWQKDENPYRTLLTKPLAVTTEQIGSAAFSFTLGMSEYNFSVAGIECLGCSIGNEGVGGSGGGQLRLTGVKGSGNCQIPSTITTANLSFSARYEESKLELIKFVPTKGVTTAFFTLPVAGCASEGTYNVFGSLFGKLGNPPGTQAVSQPVGFSPSINSAAGGGLSIASKPVNLTATGNLKAGGTYFGVAPGGVALPEATQTAAKWYRGTTAGGVTELTGSQEVTAEQKGSSTFTATSETGQEYVINASGVECLECTISNSPNGGSGSGKLNLTGLTVGKPAGCSATFGSAKLTLEANWVQGERALVKFRPTKGESTAFGTFAISGCPQETNLVPKGSLFARLSGSLGMQATSQTLEFRPAFNNDAGGNFRVGSEPATLTATDIFKAGGLYFGIK
jgi:hypothetical protein